MYCAMLRSGALTKAASNTVSEAGLCRLLVFGRYLCMLAYVTLYVCVCVCVETEVQAEDMMESQ